MHCHFYVRYAWESISCLGISPTQKPALHFESYVACNCSKLLRGAEASGAYSEPSVSYQFVGVTSAIVPRRRRPPPVVPTRPLHRLPLEALSLFRNYVPHCRSTRVSIHTSCSNYGRRPTLGQACRLHQVARQGGVSMVGSSVMEFDFGDNSGVSLFVSVWRG